MSTTIRDHLSVFPPSPLRVTEYTSYHAWRSALCSGWGDRWRMGELAAEEWAWFAGHLGVRGGRQVAVAADGQVVGWTSEGKCYIARSAKSGDHEAGAVSGSYVDAVVISDLDGMLV